MPSRSRATPARLKLADVLLARGEVDASAALTTSC
jgi:hypothetical protein